VHVDEEAILSRFSIEGSPMSRLHCLKGLQRSFRCFPWGVLAPVIAVVMLCSHTPAYAGLTINATFDSSITSQPDAAGIEGAINAGIAVLQADISNPITVNIYFAAMNTGLGESISSLYLGNYSDYYNAFKAVATSPAQLSALASLGPAPSPGGPNPVNGNSGLVITGALGRALGFNTPGFLMVGPNSYDTIIGLNTSLTFPPQPNNGSTVGLQSVATHEMDEALGIGGSGSQLNSGTTGPIGPLDLYRYAAPGVRSYSQTQTTSPFSYFSIDGGTTVLTYFNQTNGADYGDWLSNPIPGGFGPQVQDAFAAAGTNPALGVNELTALNVIGYNLTSVVPEPSTVTMLGIAMLFVSGYGWSRRKQWAGKTAA
jgi:hypothetical protein